MVREGMRGDDQQQNHIFSYLSPEMRVRKDHPLRAIRAMVDEVLTQLSRRFDAMYARVGRPSIAPEKLLRAQFHRGCLSLRAGCLSRRWKMKSITSCREPKASSALPTVAHALGRECGRLRR